MLEAKKNIITDSPPPPYDQTNGSCFSPIKKGIDQRQDKTVNLRVKIDIET